MTVPSWRSQPESSSNISDRGRQSRKRRIKANRSIVEQLETRQLLTFSATLSGSVATLTVGATTDSVTFSQDGSGDLEHNTLTAPAGQTFADNLDFDSTVAGSQHLAVSAASTVDVGGPAYSATIGTSGSPASGLLADFGLTGASGSSVAIDDSGSSTSNTYTATGTAITGTGINVGLTGSAFGSVGLTTSTGTNNFVNVQGDSSPLTITNPGGFDTVNVGNAGLLSGITQPLTISAGFNDPTSVIVSDAADTANTNGDLIATGANTAALTGLAPATINLSTGNGNVLAIDSGTATNTQTIDFSAGNPVPNGLTYLGGGGSNTLILQGELPGGPFSTDVYNATAPGQGTITLSDTLPITFSGLKPVIDTTPSTNYTYNYTPGLDARISVGAGATVGGTPTTLISSFSDSSQFEQVSYANKTNVTINSGAGNDVVSVTGSALLPGSNTTINGQAGTNTLNYDAGGETVVITPTGTAGQETITRPGSGSLLVENFQQINVVNGQVQGVPVVSPTFTTSTPIKGTDGTALTNVVVATFTSSDPNATAASFGSTITWGDGTTTAGTIVPDASNPTVFYVEGSHTYTAPSTGAGFAIGVSVSEKENNTSALPGVTITQTSTAATTNTASISDAPLTAQGATLSSVAGKPLTQALVATFNYAGGAVPVGNFTGTITWGDGSSTVATITAVGTSASGTTYTASGTHTYSTFGTFPVSVTITSTGGSAATATGSAVVTDAPIVAPSPIPAITATEGSAFTGTVTAFTDSNTSATAADFQATITWGNGLVTTGTVAGSAGAFSVSGTNTYAKAGSYSAVVSIRDTGIDGGSTATIVVPVTVAGAVLTPLAATSFVENDLVPFTTVVGSFTSANPSASASDFSATIGWADNSPTSAGTITEDASGVFHVTGSHTYALATGPDGALPVTVNVRENASGQLTILAAAVSVADAPLTAQGATITAIEGTPLTQGLVASFTYAGGVQSSTYFGGTINWGDGTTSTITSADITEVTPPTGTTPTDDVTYLVNATHTFPTQGIFPVTVSLDTINGSTAVAHATADVADALSVTVFPMTLAENTGFNNQVVATFADAGTPDPVSKYSVTINWGDGSAIVPGTIVQAPNGTFEVVSSHKYTTFGTFPVSVTVTDDLTGVTTATASYTVNPLPEAIIGQLNPASDSGESSTDAITNDSTPNFFGVATPGSIVRVYAIPVGSTVPSLIGTTVSNAAGSWSVTALTLADGEYDIVATATDSSGLITAQKVLLPNALQGPLVVDTVAPKVEYVRYQPLSGQIQVTLQDNASGLDQAQVINGLNYSFSRISALPGQANLTKGAGLPLPRSYTVTGLATTPSIDPTAPQLVTLTINDGKAIRGGYYRFEIYSGGIEDVAGNDLDGEFYGYFPSGNNIPGGNFIAELSAIHNKVLAPTAIGSTATPVTPPGTLPGAGYIPTVTAASTSSGVLMARDVTPKATTVGSRAFAPAVATTATTTDEASVKAKSVTVGKVTPRATKKTTKK